MHAHFSALSAVGAGPPASITTRLVTRFEGGLKRATPTLTPPARVVEAPPTALPLAAADSSHLLLAADSATRTTTVLLPTRREVARVTSLRRSLMLAPNCDEGGGGRGHYLGADKHAATRLQLGSQPVNRPAGSPPPLPPTSRGL